MAGERCDVNKDEAKILKPSSSSPPLTSQSSVLAAQEFPAPERPERLQAATTRISCPLKPEEESRSSPPIRRCLICRKRVGLTCFRCRCGDLFCSLHRHSDAHDCSFDYKAAGREQIAKNNPLIRAAKIIKI
ncbi:zinc finger AN1 domain-containing stress-associated protein 15-like [Curcuma longa]|uniref:zinc finger AN1 domain-containing stress-associated protein 15-like n=1 Tax=Curcuma longa TaxID=136217 RepID=UPI003D9F5056